MKKSYILVIDSGVGGVSILKALKDELKTESFIYVADNKNSPYGEKTKKFLQQNIVGLIESLKQKYNIKLIVFACNTLTSTTINLVRKKFKIQIVGTEPPVKQVNNNEKTLVLSTTQTLKNCKILKDYKENNNFTFTPLKNVAKCLDENFFNRDKIVTLLKKQIKKQSYKNIVLGCTHYCFLEEEIKYVLSNNDLVFYSSIDGVTKRVKQLLVNLEKKHPTTKILLTKPDKKLKKIIKFILSN